MKFSIVYSLFWLIVGVVAFYWLLSLHQKPEPNYKEGFKDEWCDFK